MPGAIAVREEVMKGTPQRTDVKRYPFAEEAYICNILPMRWGPIAFDFGNFTIEPCKPGEEYELTEINDRISVMDVGEKHRTEQAVGALDIAHDLVRMINENAGGGADGKGGYMGVFVCKGSKPTKEELAAAHEKMRAFAEHYVHIADDEYARFGRPAFIPDFARFCATYLKREKEWNVDTSVYVACPGCQKGISPKAVRCPYCQAVIDEQKARKLYPQLFTHEHEKPIKTI
jgi:hypothetical protein